MRKLLLVLMIPFFALSQEIATDIDTTEIAIGEPINLEIFLKGFGNKSVQFPVLNDTLNGSFEIINQNLDSIKLGEKKALRKTYQVSVYEPGEFLLKPISVLVGDDTLRSKSFRVKVNDVPTDSAQYFANKPLIETEFTLRDYWNKYWLYLVLLLIVTLALIAVAVLYFRGKNKGKIKPENLLSPLDEALNSLQELDNIKDSLQLKAYYFKLEQILKRYLNRHYSIESQYIFNQDLLLYLRKKDDFPLELSDDFSQYLLDSDLVKFAKAKPEPELTDYYRTLVEDVIRKTKPIIIYDENLLVENSQVQTHKKREYGDI